MLQAKGSEHQLGMLETLPLPLPPFAEQQRIVAKVDQLMRLCDELEAGLAQAEIAAASVTAAMLQRVVDP